MRFMHGETTNTSWVGRCVCARLHAFATQAASSILEAVGPLHPCLGELSNIKRRAMHYMSWITIDITSRAMPVDEGRAAQTRRGGAAAAPAASESAIKPAAISAALI